MPGSAPPGSRSAAFRQELERDIISISALKALTAEGVPEEDKGLRSLVWKARLDIRSSTPITQVQNCCMLCTWH